MAIFKRRLLVLFYMFQALLDGLSRVPDYNALAKEVMAKSRDDYSRFHLSLRFRACSLVMKIAERIGSKWACRHFSIMMLRACFREHAPSNLTFEMRKEDGRWVGHITIGESENQSPGMSVKLPFDEKKQGEWKRG
jgi:hypothetical protein